MQIRTYAPTTYRPPAFPVAVAAIYKIFGRHFFIVRLMNMFFIATAITLAASMAIKYVGVLPAILVAIIAALDPVIGTCAVMFWTESMAMVWVTMVVWAVALMFERRQAKWVIVTGISLGLVVLTRSMFILWYPPMAILVWIAFKMTRSDQPPTKIKPAMAVVLFLSTATLIPLPWWFRNCQVLNGFMPLGTQGGIGIPGGYSNEAFSISHGEWTDATTSGDYFEPVEKESWFKSLSVPEQERERSRFGMKQTIGWIKKNPEKVPYLILLKIKNHFSFKTYLDGWVMLLSLIGLAILWPKRTAIIPLVFVLINALCVAAFYSDKARFLIPVKPMLYLYAGIGLYGLSVWLYPQIQLIRAKLLLHRDMSI